MILRDFFLGLIASILLVIGKICIAVAVANGLAGPAASLGNTQVIHVFCLTVLVQNSPFSLIEIIGLI
jgi:hypothetical protein